MKKRTDDELVFLPLGGSNEIGMNFNAYGFGPAHDRKWIIVDVGVTFGDLSTPGVDVIVPETIDPRVAALSDNATRAAAIDPN